MEDFFTNNKFLSETRIMCRKCGCCKQQMESHHVWCKFMDNPHGNTFKEGQPNRYWLCQECHRNLHQNLIIPLLNKLTETLKHNGSEGWMWKQASQEDKPRIILVITESTIKWVENNGDTRKT